MGMFAWCTMENMLPDPLREKIDSLIEKIPLRILERESQKLSHLYRVGEGIQSDDQRLVYLLVRMPATYAVIQRVLKEIAVHPKSILDIGAGPGTGWWAMQDPNSLWTCFEKNPEFIRLGKQLCPSPHIKWVQQEVRPIQEFEPHDLVIASFFLGELPDQNLEKIVKKMWEATKETLVLIEPGTPKAFERMRALRSFLIAEGAHLVAPCPHDNRCPMQGKDWCHFSVRVSRSSFHRQIKGGSLNYEDEKFTYLIFSRKKEKLGIKRILSHPEKKSGHIRLKLCTESGLEHLTITRSSGDVYRVVKKKEWGDLL